MKPTSTSRPENVHLLAFGAHPDDIEFGCGGVVARESRAGRSVHFVLCSRGESATNGTPEQRAAEAANAAAILGASLEWIDLGGDAHIESSVARTIQIASILRRVRPLIVLAPSVVENQHPDHAAVGRMVRDAARLARYGGVEELKAATPHAIACLFYYAVTPDAVPRDISPVLADVSPPEIVVAWTRAMEAHGSQLRTRNYVELQLARARSLGLQAGVGHAIALFPNDPPLVDSLEMFRRSARRF